MTHCQVDQLRSWTDKLKRLTSSTWQMVAAAPKVGLGHETIPRKQLKFPVPADITEDVPFLVFRFGHSERMIGYRERSVLHVLWLSFDHGAY